MGRNTPFNNTPRRGVRPTRGKRKGERHRAKSLALRQRTFIENSTYVSGITSDSLGCYRFANVIYRQAIYFKNLSIPLRVKVARPPVASQKLD